MKKENDGDVEDAGRSSPFAYIFLTFDRTRAIIDNKGIRHGAGLSEVIVVDVVDGTAALWNREGNQILMKY